MTTLDDYTTPEAAQAAHAAAHDLLLELPEILQFVTRAQEASRDYAANMTEYPDDQYDQLRAGSGLEKLDAALGLIASYCAEADGPLTAGGIRSALAAARSMVDDVVEGAADSYVRVLPTLAVIEDELLVADLHAGADR